MVVSGVRLRLDENKFLCQGVAWFTVLQRFSAVTRMNRDGGGDHPLPTHQDLALSILQKAGRALEVGFSAELAVHARGCIEKWRSEEYHAGASLIS